MKVIVVVQEPGRPIGVYSVPDTFKPEDLERMQQRLYNEHREMLITAFLTLNPGFERANVSVLDVPVVGTWVLPLIDP